MLDRVRKKFNENGLRKLFYALWNKIKKMLLGMRFYRCNKWAKRNVKQKFRYKNSEIIVGGNTPDVRGSFVDGCEVFQAILCCVLTR